jgi:hypothetical protein
MSSQEGRMRMRQAFTVSGAVIALLVAIVLALPSTGGVRVGDAAARTPSAAARPAKVTTKTLTLSTGSPVYLDTGVDLAKGASATISVKGNGTCHAGGGFPCPDPGSPNGAGPLCAAYSVPPGPAGPNVPFGAVAGRVGNAGTPFLIGAGKTVAGPGELFLVYNDCEPPTGYSDNAGSFKVSVTYDRTDKVKLSGRVVSALCETLDCRHIKTAGVEGARVVVSGAGGPKQAKTDAHGDYKVTVRAGRHTLRVAGSGGSQPASRALAQRHLRAGLRDLPRPTGLQGREVGLSAGRDRWPRRRRQGRGVRELGRQPAGYRERAR